MGGLKMAVVGLMSAMASAFLVSATLEDRSAVAQVFEAPPAVKTAPAGEQPIPEDVQRRLVQLEERLRDLDDVELWVEAARLGVAREVVLARTGLSPRQEQRLAVTIIREAKKNGLDPLLVTALIRIESSFDNFAVSNVGALGLMQIMPDTGQWLAEQREEPLRNSKNLFDFEKNVALGCGYLKSLIHQMGSVEAALLAYNAGPGAAKRILTGADRKAREKAFQPYARKVLAEYARLTVAARPLTGVRTASLNKLQPSRE